MCVRGEGGGVGWGGGDYGTCGRARVTHAFGEVGVRLCS
jgi:hypothetical protein